MTASEQESWLETARAAIQAIRLPTFAMAQAFTEKRGDNYWSSPDDSTHLEWYGNRAEFSEDWAHAIDAALASNTSKPS